MLSGGDHHSFASRDSPRKLRFALTHSLDDLPPNGLHRSPTPNLNPNLSLQPSPSNSYLQEPQALLVGQQPAYQQRRARVEVLGQFARHVRQVQADVTPRAEPLQLHPRVRVQRRELRARSLLPLLHVLLQVVVVGRGLVVLQRVPGFTRVLGGSG